MIPKSLVEKYYDDVCFLVDTKNTYVQEVTPRVPWLRPLPYEINIDEVIVVITTLLAKKVDSKVDPFNKYEVAKANIILKVNTTPMNKRRKNMIKDLEGKLGKEDKMEAPLHITQGMGDDRSSDEDQDQEDQEGK